MAIGLSYKTNAIQPELVYFPGQVFIAAGPIIDTANTVTPGITVTRQGVGLYTLTFDDGVAVANVTCDFTHFHTGAGQDPLQVVTVGAAGSKAGSTALSLEVNTLAGVLADPDADGGFTYIMTRINTSVLVQ